jgi:hypothetical protein
LDAHEKRTLRLGKVVDLSLPGRKHSIVFQSSILFGFIRDGEFRE